MALAQVDPRHRFTVRQGRIVPHVEPFAGAHHRGEQAQLAAGTAALALQTCLGQAGLLHGALDQGVTERLDLLGDGLEKGRTGLEAGLAVAIEGRPGQFAGALDLGLGTCLVARLEGLTGGRIDGVDGLALGLDGLAADQLLSFQSHVGSFSLAGMGLSVCCLVPVSTPARPAFNARVVIVRDGRSLSPVDYIGVTLVCSSSSVGGASGLRRGRPKAGSSIS